MDSDSGSSGNFIYEQAVYARAHIQGMVQPWNNEAWLFRDDIGSPHGIKGYEEQVNSVGMHHGHLHWANEVTMGTYNSATLRRGFKVF